MGQLAGPLSAHPLGAMPSPTHRQRCSLAALNGSEWEISLPEYTQGTVCVDSPRNRSPCPKLTHYPGNREIDMRGLLMYTFRDKITVALREAVL